MSKWRINKNGTCSRVGGEEYLYEPPTQEPITLCTDFASDDYLYFVIDAEQAAFLMINGISYRRIVKIENVNTKEIVLSYEYLKIKENEINNKLKEFEKYIPLIEATWALREKEEFMHGFSGDVICENDIFEEYVTVEEYISKKQNEALNYARSVDSDYDENCRKKDNKLETNITKYSYVYIIKCWNELECFYKIGKADYGAKQRFSSSNSMPYRYELLLEVKTTSENVFQFESELHSSQIDNKYKPNIEFAGWTECFLDLNWEKLQPIIDKHRR